MDTTNVTSAEKNQPVEIFDSENGLYYTLVVTTIFQISLHNQIAITHLASGQENDLSI